MPRFPRRTDPPPPTNKYGNYRPLVREDFWGTCAYCLLPELLAGGEENFELDHFRPKSKFRHLETEFYNLYYSCHPCNKIKRDYWPPPEVETKGIGFVDLCVDDFSSHFAVAGDCEWRGQTDSARYTIDRLRLNKKALLTIRKLLKDKGFELSELRINLGQSPPWE